MTGGLIARPSFPYMRHMFRLIQNLNIVQRILVQCNKISIKPYLQLSSLRPLWPKRQRTIRRRRLNSLQRTHPSLDKIHKLSPIPAISIDIVPRHEARNIAADGDRYPPLDRQLQRIPMCFSKLVKFSVAGGIEEAFTELEADLDDGSSGYEHCLLLEHEVADFLVEVGAMFDGLYSRFESG